MNEEDLGVNSITNLETLFHVINVRSNRFKNLPTLGKNSPVNAHFPLEICWERHVRMHIIVSGIGS